VLQQKTTRASWLLAGALLLSAPAFAQDGKAEVSGFAGGIAFGQGVGVRPLLGGSAGVRVTRHLRVFGEFSFATLGNITINAPAATNRLYNAGGGVDYSFGSSAKFVPYVLGAAGLCHEVASEAGISVSLNCMYLGGGGGVRIYVGDHWGFKPEVRYQRDDDGNAGVFIVGVFYQFGK
jgi:hypothetical protein